MHLTVIVKMNKLVLLMVDESLGVLTREAHELPTTIINEIFMVL